MYISEIFKARNWFEICISNFGKCFIPLDRSNNKCGGNCALDCQCHIKHTLSCDAVFGKCCCKSGWSGDVCTEGKLMFIFQAQKEYLLYYHAEI